MSVHNIHSLYSHCVKAVTCYLKTSHLRHVCYLKYIHNISDLSQYKIPNAQMTR